MNNMRWQGDSQGKFTVNTAYRDINPSNNQVECWPWKMIWRFKIPYKTVCFFILVLVRGISNSRQPSYKGLSTTFQMYLCTEQTKTINHMFLHCTCTNQMWSIFINLSGIRLGMLGRGLLDRRRNKNFS